MADAVVLAARRVRMLGEHVLHVVTEDYDDPRGGRTYRTFCGMTLSVAWHKPILSTRDATCWQCSRRKNLGGEMPVPNSDRHDDSDPCVRCGEETSPANGIFVHAATGRSDSTKNGFHHARPATRPQSGADTRA